jgi:hypothetical protein
MVRLLMSSWVGVVRRIFSAPVVMMPHLPAVLESQAITARRYRITEVPRVAVIA